MPWLHLYPGPQVEAEHQLPHIRNTAEVVLSPASEEVEPDKHNHDWLQSALTWWPAHLQIQVKCSKNHNFHISGTNCSGCSPLAGGYANQDLKLHATGYVSYPIAAGLQNRDPCLLYTPLHPPHYNPHPPTPWNLNLSYCAICPAYRLLYIFTLHYSVYKHFPHSCATRFYTVTFYVCNDKINS